MLSRRETKILATLGTASASPDMMRTLIREGVDGFRINMSHMCAEELNGWVRSARSAAAAEGAPVAVVVDLGGPKLRVGPLPDGRLTLAEKAVMILGRDLPVSHPEILADIRPGQRILLDDGNLELEGLGAVGDGFQVRVSVSVIGKTSVRTESSMADDKRLVFRGKAGCNPARQRTAKLKQFVIARNFTIVKNVA